MPPLTQCPTEIRDRLTGPVPSLRTPFLRDGAIDFDGLRRMIDYLIASGARALMLTAGDSHYVALSEAEIAEVTRVTVQHTAGRAFVIAADRYYSTCQAVAFARYAAEVKADLLMVMPPDWAGSTTPESIARHYRAVSEIMPVMIVTNVFISRGLAFGLDTLRRVMDDAPNVVAVKDDMCGEFARKMSLLVDGRLAIVSGGQKQNHLNNHPYGCDGYLSTFMTIQPDIAHAYWRAVKANDLLNMRRIIRDFDNPFFEFVFGLPGGFDAGMHGMLELIGLVQRWRRPPYVSLNDEDMARLRTLMTRLGVLR